jgi:hypothetical protein
MAMLMFHFTIRDVLWLVIVISLGLGCSYFYTLSWIKDAMCRDELLHYSATTQELRARIAELERSAEPNP